MMVSFSSIGQVSGVKKKRSYVDSCAKSHVVLLKKGVLLVRLQTREKLLSSLLAKKDDAEFNNQKRIIALEHLEIVNAVRANYHFSEYYFFYSHQSGRVKKRDFNGVILNDSLQVVDIVIEKFHVLDPYTIEFKAMNSHQSGISVLDSDFVQLEKPFPYYVRKRDALKFLRRDYIQMIQLLQKNLDFSVKKWGLISG
ncbi:MAG: hypothetical protein HOL28_09850 [Crocinitomicaceae bacterium]|nr:hypothetical protein [Crocinitomicaceae bacterium]